MKRTNDFERGAEHRFYSGNAVMRLLKINVEGLRKLERAGKLNLCQRGGVLSGYPANEVERLLKETKEREAGRHE